MSICAFFIQGLDFLDLTDASEEESALLHKILYTRNPNKKYPKLPWRTQLDPVQSPAEWGPSYGKLYFRT